MRPIGALAALGPLAYRVAPPRHGGVALVGDAAGFYDPFTGEGLFTALRSAELLAGVAQRALAAGDVSRAALRSYGAALRDERRGKERLAAALQLTIAHRRLANLAARVLARRPALLDTLMGVIGDFVPPGCLLRG
jgi:flavin-dependent dehydrogenase